MFLKEILVAFCVGTCVCVGDDTGEGVGCEFLAGDVAGECVVLAAALLASNSSFFFL